MAGAPTFAQVNYCRRMATASILRNVSVWDGFPSLQPTIWTIVHLDMGTLFCIRSRLIAPQSILRRQNCIKGHQKL